MHAPAIIQNCKCLQDKKYLLKLKDPLEMKQNAMDNANQECT